MAPGRPALERPWQGLTCIASRPPTQLQLHHHHRHSDRKTVLTTIYSTASLVLLPFPIPLLYTPSSSSFPHPHPNSPYSLLPLPYSIIEVQGVAWGSLSPPSPPFQATYPTPHEYLRLPTTTDDDLTILTIA
jgi:hypothetical protein